MKYLREFNDINEFITEVSENPVNYPTLNLIKGDGDTKWNKKMYYNKVMTDRSNPEAMQIARTAGWVGPTDTYMTFDQAFAVTDASFNAANVSVYNTSATNGYASTFSSLKHFKEFRYFINVKKTTWTKTSDDPVTYEGGFFNATNLEDVVFPPTFQWVGTYGFGYCSKLKELDFPLSMRQINSYSFYNCTSLENVNMNTGLVAILSNSFTNTKIGTKTVQQLPNTLTHIFAQAFYTGSNSKFPETVTLPNLKVIGYEVFTNVTGPRVFNIGDKLETIGGGPDYTGEYNDCFWTHLETITIDANNPNFKVINNIVYSKSGTHCYGGADYGLSKQNVVKIEEGVTKILAGSFRDFMAKWDYGSDNPSWYSPASQVCQYIVFPSTLTYLGNRCGQYSRSVNIVCLAETPPTMESHNWLSCGNIYVPSASVAAYKAASGWSGKASRIYAITDAIMNAIS